MVVIYHTLLAKWRPGTKRTPLRPWVALPPKSGSAKIRSTSQRMGPNPPPLRPPIVRYLVCPHLPSQTRLIHHLTFSSGSFDDPRSKWLNPPPPFVPSPRPRPQKSAPGSPFACSFPACQAPKNSASPRSLSSELPRGWCCTGACCPPEASDPWRPATSPPSAWRKGPTCAHGALSRREDSPSFGGGGGATWVGGQHRGFREGGLRQHRGPPQKKKKKEMKGGGVRPVVGFFETKFKKGTLKKTQTQEESHVHMVLFVSCFM